MGRAGSATYREDMEIVIGLGAAWVAAAALLTGALCRAAAIGDLAWADRDCATGR